MSASTSSLHSSIEYDKYCIILNEKQNDMDKEYSKLYDAMKQQQTTLREKYTILKDELNELMYAIDVEFHSQMYDEDTYNDMCMSLEWCKHDIQNIQYQQKQTMEHMDYLKQYYSWNCMVIKLKCELFETMKKYGLLQSDSINIDMNVEEETGDDDIWREKTKTDIETMEEQWRLDTKERLLAEYKKQMMIYNESIKVLDDTINTGKSRYMVFQSLYFK